MLDGAIIWFMLVCAYTYSISNFQMVAIINSSYFRSLHKLIKTNTVLGILVLTTVHPSINERFQNSCVLSIVSLLVRNRQTRMILQNTSFSFMPMISHTIPIAL